MNRKEIRTFRENGIWNIAVGIDGSGTEVILQLDPARPVRMKNKQHDLSAELLPILSVLDDDIKVSFMTDIRNKVFIKQAPAVQDALQALLSYELVDGTAFSLTRLKQLSDRTDDKLHIVVMDNLDSLLEKYGVIVTTLLRKIQQKHCVILAETGMNRYKDFLKQFFPVVLDESSFTLYEADKDSFWYFDRLYRRAVVDIFKAGRESELSDEEKTELCEWAISLKTDRKTFIKLFESADKEVLKQDDLIYDSIRSGSSWMLEELFKAGLKLSEYDSWTTIERLMIDMSTDRNFEEHINVLKKYYPAWFTSPVHGFYLLFFFLKNAFHNDYLVPDNDYGSENYWKHLDAEKTTMFRCLLANVHPDSPYGHDDCRENLLHAAVEHSEYLHSLFTEVAELGIALDTLNEYGKAALHQSTKQEDTFMTEKLIRIGTDINVRDSDGSTPLFNANLENIRILLAAGADTTIRNNEELTSFMHAVDEFMYKDEELEQLYLLAESYDENICTREGRNGLMKAAYVEIFDKKLYQLLLERTSDINRKDKSGRTFLYYLVENVTSGNEEFITEALNAGADPSVRLPDGSSIIHALSGRNILEKDEYLKIIRLLPEELLDSQAQNGNTALHLAVMHDEVQLVLALLEAGASKYIRNNDGKYPDDLPTTSRWKARIRKYLSRSYC